MQASPVASAAGPEAEPLWVKTDAPGQARPTAGVRKKVDAALRVIEASYTANPDQHEWLRGIQDELEGAGLGSWCGYLTSNALPVPGSELVIAGTSLVMNESAGAKELCAKLHREACLPERRIVSASANWSRIVGETEFSVPEVEALFGVRIPFVTALLCTETTGEEGAVFLLDNERPMAPRTRLQLEAVAAHIEHAYRLRRRVLQSWSADDAQAVLSPEGKLLHATSDAVPEAPSLAQAVKRSEKARGRLRRLDPDEAVQTWKALVDGQWSVVEHTESDGKRLLLAFENAPVAPELGLSAQQRRIVSYAALGHSQKYIAYELGISPSAVSVQLKGALQKLRLASQQELIRAFGPRARRGKK